MGEKIYIGAWVLRKNFSDLGIVKKIDDNLYFVNWVNRKTMITYGYGWFDETIIYLAPLEFDEQERDLIYMDMALLSGDIEWAKELSTNGGG